MARKPTFERWMVRVDKCLTNRVGMASNDMEDFTWRDYYDDDNSPAEAINDFMERNWINAQLM